MENKNDINAGSAEQENLDKTVATVTEATVPSSSADAGEEVSADKTMPTMATMATMEETPQQPEGEAATSKPPQSTRPTSQPSKPAGSSGPSRILQDGDRLGKYRIVKRLGKGGMGEVYLAKHEQLDILRAIKVLPDDLAKKNSQFFSRFIREAKTACEIRHSNIVNVMDVETDPVYSISYIVMEYVDGGDVRGLLKSSGRLTVDQTLVIVEAVTSALAAASEYGIVHRDIKPDNIMLTKRGEVKLADLGIAKSGDEDVQLTRTNVMMGTPAYLSPEQAKDAKHVDVRADIYSLGATMFEMLTGRIPYPGNNVYDILSKLHTEPVPNPCDFNPEVPPEIGKITMTMMAKKPEHRYQNAGELLEVLSRCRAHQKTVIEAQKIIRDAIQTAYGAEGVRTSMLSTTQQKRRSGKKLAVIVPVACLVVMALLAVLILFFRKTPEPVVIVTKTPPAAASPTQTPVTGKAAPAQPVQPPAPTGPAVIRQSTGTAADPNMKNIDLTSSHSGSQSSNDVASITVPKSSTVTQTSGTSARDPNTKLVASVTVPVQKNGSGPKEVTTINILAPASTPAEARAPARSQRGGITVTEVKTGNPDLDRYIAKNGAEIKLKGSSGLWKKVRFPYTWKNLKEGKYFLLFRIPEKKIRGQESEEIEVEEGKLTEYSMFLATF